VSSVHTKHALEVHPNIRVFRHPDHIPKGQELHEDLIEGLKNLSFSPFHLAQLPGKQIESIYGASDDIVLYW
jgi:phospholipase D1/2